MQNQQLGDKNAKRGKVVFLHFLVSRFWCPFFLGSQVVMISFQIFVTFLLTEISRQPSP